MVKALPTSRHAHAEPRVRRGYFESRYGQLHVHNAIPPGGGFEEGTSLLCIHAFPFSGHTFRAFLSVAGRDRSVYAPDLPGFGESDPPATRPSVQDYASAIGDFLDSMRFRQIDVLGHQTGSLIAAELAITRPQQIRRVVLTSIPAFTDAEREAFRRAPWPVPPAEDGSHLMIEWKRSLEVHLPGTPLAITAHRFTHKLRNGPEAWYGMNAAMQYPVRERIAAIPQPVLVVRPKDEWWDATARLRDSQPRARYVDLPEGGAEVFESSPQSVVDASAEFLRG